ncbi:uncharacterized protein TRIADDRAFT_51353 [Trichoplax adhaerens]|uniref:Vang-like protein n=1 Tax=Trichoplax adhaerens TaxID=10228 RepID=B3RIS9_TRIAD|nr:hypothetical protein TRIADDRAFT_51353 [Trichoplax adhaerens]EDV28441.1 hypothetical protein TRIADDRAFT_51353 [Trichoplax adhaerens]|eukprot:XP_002107643.1 hypothetical protein TRIADDRAFT_51353 [Trichoplax adhaerens]
MSSQDGEDVVEVHVIRQDENWGVGPSGRATSIATSDRSAGMGNVTFRRDHDDDDDENPAPWNSLLSIGVPIAVGTLALLTPLIFILLPFMMGTTWQLSNCGNYCNGSYLTLAIKEIILLIGIWALYSRHHSHYTLPRLISYKLFVLSLVLMVTICYWIYYVVAVIIPKSSDYASIVDLAVSLVDIFLFLHYISLILLEIRQQRNHTQFILKVVRDPDGQQQYYHLHRTSIQLAALTILQYYYRDFTAYNSAMEKMLERYVGRSQTALTLYDIDGRSGDVEAMSTRSRSVITASTKRGAGSAINGNRNDRYHNETEFYKRIDKRRARLIAAAEEAFEHINRLRQDEQDRSGPPMNPDDVAHAIFPCMARQLQKYLRATKQQTWYKIDSILRHLSHCVALGATSKTFLQRYLTTRHCAIPLEDDDRNKPHHWSLESELPAHKSLHEGAWFVLKRNEVSLIVSVVRLPQYNITEHTLDHTGRRIRLNPNPETSV